MFTVGDIVKLKSGGPDMVVTNTSDDGVWGRIRCAWFGHIYGAVYSHVFPADALVTVVKDAAVIVDFTEPQPTEPKLRGLDDDDVPF